MSINEFIKYLSNTGIKLNVLNGQLQCHAPSGMLTSDMLILLKERKSEIINFLDYCNPTILKNNSFKTERNSNTHPLSFSQKYLWKIEQNLPNAAYNIPIGFNIEGNIDIEAFEWSINEIIKRHEVLRTNIVISNEQPLQVIHPFAQWKIPFLDSSLQSENQDVWIQQQFNVEEIKRFDLAHDRLLRIKILRIDSQRHAILFTTHQIIFDMWSWKIFFTELKQLYNNARTKNFISLMSLKTQYSDYVNKETMQYNSTTTQSSLIYWEKKIDELQRNHINIPFIKLSTDMWTYAGSESHVFITDALTLSLKKVAQNHKATVSMVILAVYAVLIYRLLNIKSLSICCPLTTRHNIEAENLLGLFITNTIVSIELSDESSFEDIIYLAKSSLLDCHAHLNIPSEAILIKNDLFKNNQPLIQFIYNFQETDRSIFSLDELKISPLYTNTCTAKCCLTLSLKSNGVDIKGRIEYSTDIFNEHKMTLLSSELQRLLHIISYNPNIKLCDLCSND